MNTTMLHHHRGQTLVEVLLTVAIVCMGVIALIRFQSYLAYDNSLTEQKAAATLLAVKQIEQLRDFQVLNTTSGYTAYSNITTGSSTSTGTTTTYTISWTVTNNTNPTYKTIDVTVSWTDRYNSAQSVRMISRVAGIDPQNSAAII